MKLLFLVFLLSALQSGAQLPPSPDSSMLLALNSRIDELVVHQQVNEVDSLYADDFVFSHGSGNITGKDRWMKTVGRTKYLVRQHDSVTVQQHRDVAVVKGKMYIERVDKTGVAKYRLRYIRVFAMRNGFWHLISHNTTDETHL